MRLSSIMKFWQLKKLINNLIITTIWDEFDFFPSRYKLTSQDLLSPVLSLPYPTPLLFLFVLFSSFFFSLFSLSLSSSFSSSLVGSYFLGFSCVNPSNFSKMLPNMPFLIATFLNSLVLFSAKELSNISKMYLKASTPTSLIEVFSSYILHNKLNKILKHFLWRINELKNEGSWLYLSTLSIHFDQNSLTFSFLNVFIVAFITFIIWLIPPRTSNWDKIGKLGS